MPNQKDIANALGISQTAVSMALRGDKSVSVALRKKVRETAKKLGYHPNAYLTVLMSNIRKGKSLSDKGVIGMLIEARSQEEWYKNESYRIFHQGAIQRAGELGFCVENFFLHKPEMCAERIDQILYARGIAGVILAPPYRSNRMLKLKWNRYTAVGAGFGWEQQELNRVAYASLYNFTLAFNELRNLGYKRIGTVLGNTFINGNRHGTRWYVGYLDCQNSIPEHERIPVLSSNNPPPEKDFSEKDNHILEDEFKEWFLKWKPDALLTMVGREKKWLESLNLKVPRDIGLACLALPANLRWAGIDEKGEIVGAAALELVAAQLARNEFGPSPHPKTTMIEGRWVRGTTVRKITKNNCSARAI